MKKGNLPENWAVQCPEDLTNPKLLEILEILGWLRELERVEKDYVGGWFTSDSSWHHDSNFDRYGCFTRLTIEQWHGLRDGYAFMTYGGVAWDCAKIDKDGYQGYSGHKPKSKSSWEKIIKLLKQTSSFIEAIKILEANEKFESGGITYGPKVCGVVCEQEYWVPKSVLDYFKENSKEITKELNRRREERSGDEIFDECYNEVTAGNPHGFKLGDLIEVSEEGNIWNKGIFLFTIKNRIFVSLRSKSLDEVGSMGSIKVTGWKYGRLIKKKKYN